MPEGEILQKGMPDRQAVQAAYYWRDHTSADRDIRDRRCASYHGKVENRERSRFCRRKQHGYPK